jgi:hypothetical protein
MRLSFGGKQTSKRREDPTMKTFAVTVERQISQTHDLEIQAESSNEARELAEDEIPNIDNDDWDIGHADEPEVTKVVELSNGDESEEGSEAENEAV